MEHYTLKFVPPNKYPSQCLITIYRQSGLVIATDIDNGMSVTNACEIIANEIVKQHGIRPQRLIFIEQYRPGTPEQTTDLVQFTIDKNGSEKTGWFRSPRWTHLPIEEFNRMVQVAEETEVA